MTGEYQDGTGASTCKRCPIAEYQEGSVVCWLRTNFTCGDAPLGRIWSRGMQGLSKLDDHTWAWPLAGQDITNCQVQPACSPRGSRGLGDCGCRKTEINVNEAAGSPDSSLRTRQRAGNVWIEAKSPVKLLVWNVWKVLDHILFQKKALQGAKSSSIL